MRLLEIAIILFGLLLFGISSIAGAAIAMRPYIEEAKVSQLQPGTLLAMSLKELTDVQIPQRVL